MLDDTLSACDDFLHLVFFAVECHGYLRYANTHHVHSSHKRAPLDRAGLNKNIDNYEKK